jgi:hypothetical protein
VVKFRIWDGEKYRHPEPEDNRTICYGSRYIWVPMFFNTTNPTSKYELEIFTGEYDDQGNEKYEKII